MSSGYRRYRARPAPVHARQVLEETPVHREGGSVQAHKGDWIVLDGFGHATVLSNDVFHALYQIDPLAPQEDSAFRTGKRKRFE